MTTEEAKAAVKPWVYRQVPTVGDLIEGGARLPITRPSNEDILAARALLGVNSNDLREWHIPSSNGQGSYTVSERIDTLNDGTYMFCPCPGWPYQKGKGKDCSHVAQARNLP